MRCISAAYMPSCGVCLSVCVSVTFVSCVKTNNHIFKNFSLSGSHTILVFPHQTGRRYSDGNPPPLMGASNAGGVGKKRRFWANIWLRCIQVYSVVNRTSRVVWKTKPRQMAASVEHSLRRPSRRDEVFVMGSTLYARDEGKSTAPPPPPVITPFSAAIGHRRTEPGGYFCWKLALTRTPDPISPMSQGPDPNWPTNGSKQRGLWLWFCPGGFGWKPPGTNRRQQNRL